MRVLLRAGLALLVIALGLGVADVPTAAAPPLALVVLRGSGAVLTFDAGAGTVDAGRFAFSAPGLGTYVPAGQADVRRDAAGNVHATYAGAADRFAIANAAPVAAVLTLQLNVQVAGPGPRGEAELQAGDRVFHLQILQAPGELSMPTLVAFESAMRSADWTGLYGLLSSDVTSTTSAADFAADARGQTQALGAITDLRRVSIGPVQTSPQGVIYAAARYAVTRSGAGTATAYDAYFVFGDAGWKLWFTAAP